MNFDRMRSLLLEQAVRGMLVSQRDDEPAVKQIGKVPDDVPFLIPEKWKWIAAHTVRSRFAERGNSER